jgi:hypothetical protein
VQYGAVHYNPMTAIPAWIKVGEGPGTNLDSNAGLKPYYDLKANANSTSSNQASNDGTNQNIHAPAWILEIERGVSTIKTSSTGNSYQIGGGTDGQLYLPEKMDSSKMRALSKAEAYFSRPSSLFPRVGDSSAKNEWGSLYSPYWQAHLLPNSIAEQGGSILATAIF